MDPEGIGAMGQPEGKKTSIDVAEAAERPGRDRGPRTGEEGPSNPAVHCENVTFVKSFHFSSKILESEYFF